MYYNYLYKKGSFEVSTFFSFVHLADFFQKEITPIFRLLYIDTHMHSHTNT